MGLHRAKDTSQHITHVGRKETWHMDPKEKARRLGERAGEKAGTYRRAECPSERAFRHNKPRPACLVHHVDHGCLLKSRELSRNVRVSDKMLAPLTACPVSPPCTIFANLHGKPSEPPLTLLRKKPILRRFFSFSRGFWRFTGVRIVD